MSDTTGMMPALSNKISFSQGSKKDERNILGVNMCPLTAHEAIVEIEEAIESRTHRKFAFLNAHGANLSINDQNYRTVLQGFTVLADGIGVDIGSKILYGSAFPENLNGTDFIPRLLDGISRHATIGLLGATADIAGTATAVMAKNHPKHKFVMIGHGYFDAEELPGILEKLEEVKPDILLVALGNPFQEKWIAEHCNAHRAMVPIGVGALFDFTAGHVRRAPSWMISMRIEWLFRLLLEPGRMWRRYILGNPLFIIRILKQKFLGFHSKAKV